MIFQNLILFFCQPFEGDEGVDIDAGDNKAANEADGNNLKDDNDKALEKQRRAQQRETRNAKKVELAQSRSFNARDHCAEMSAETLRLNVEGQDQLEGYLKKLSSGVSATLIPITITTTTTLNQHTRTHA